MPVHSLSKFCEWIQLCNCEELSIYLPVTFRFCFVSRGKRILATVIYWLTSSHHWHYNWPLQHNAAAWTPPCSSPCGFFHLQAYGWKEQSSALWAFPAGKEVTCKNKTRHSKYIQSIYYVTKCGWLPNVSSNFSKNETSQVSPGLRHSSFCNKNTIFFLVFDCNSAAFCVITTHLTYQNGNDAFVLLLYQVTDDFVVKVLHGLPLRYNIWQRKFDKLEGKQ